MPVVETTSPEEQSVAINNGDTSLEQKPTAEEEQHLETPTQVVVNRPQKYEPKRNNKVRKARFCIANLILGLLGLLFVVFFIFWWPSVFFVFALFLANFIVFLIFLKKAKHKNIMFVLGAIFGVASLIAASIQLSSFSINSIKNREYQLTFFSEVIGGRAEITNRSVCTQCDSSSPNQIYKIKRGEQIQLAAYENPGYSFSHFDVINDKTGEKTRLESQYTDVFEEYSSTYVMPENNITITPVFDYVGNILTIDNSNSEEGKINIKSVDGLYLGYENYCYYYRVKCDKFINLTVSPNVGHSFAYWLMIGSSTSRLYNDAFHYPMPDEDIIIRAVFQ